MQAPGRQGQRRQWGRRSLVASEKKFVFARFPGKTGNHRRGARAAIRSPRWQASVSVGIGGDHDDCGLINRWCHWLWPLVPRRRVLQVASSALLRKWGMGPEQGKNGQERRISHPDKSFARSRLTNH